MKDRFVEQVITALREEGAIESDYLSDKVDSIANELFGNERHVIEAYMIVQALDKLARQTLVMEGKKHGQADKYKAFIAGFDPEEHLEDNYIIQRE